VLLDDKSVDSVTSCRFANIGVGERIATLPCFYLVILIQHRYSKAD